MKPIKDRPPAYYYRGCGDDAGRQESGFLHISHCHPPAAPLPIIIMDFSLSPSFWVGKRLERHPSGRGRPRRDVLRLSHTNKPADSHLLEYVAHAFMPDKGLVGKILVISWPVSMSHLSRGGSLFWIERQRIVNRYYCRTYLWAFQKNGRH